MLTTLILTNTNTGGYINDINNNATYTNDSNITKKNDTNATTTNGRHLGANANNFAI